uniref:Uncharacterized protein n=1 Tax=Anguilla anguilla TaxID=7936 RepID=A0A0E9QDJ7_ANGAN
MTTSNPKRGLTSTVCSSIPDSLSQSFLQNACM